MKNLLLNTAILFSMFIGIVQAQSVHIPDANFKKYLVDNKAINTNNDSEIQVSEAEAFSERIDCSSQNIADLTGIEAFVNLSYLNCSSNQLMSIDVSANSALKTLNCSFNELNHLDVSVNSDLYSLMCSFNRLNSLDVSANPALAGLECSSNELTHLDISSNQTLTILDCSSNQLSNLDVSANTTLIALDCSSNQLSNLDVRDNLTLLGLYCSFNELLSLDISANPALIELDCSSNQLSSLNLANSNNSIFRKILASANPLLNCVQVDDAEYSTAHWTNADYDFDAGIIFDEHCITTGISEDISGSFLNLYPNPVYTVLNIDLHSGLGTNIKIVNLMGVSVLSATLDQAQSSLDVSRLASGMYFIYTEKGRAAQFVKE